MVLSGVLRVWKELFVCIICEGLNKLYYIFWGKYVFIVIWFCWSIGDINKLVLRVNWLVIFYVWEFLGIVKKRGLKIGVFVLCVLNISVYRKGRSWYCYENIDCVVFVIDFYK